MNHTVAHDPVARSAGSPRFWAQCAQNADPAPSARRKALGGARGDEQGVDDADVARSLADQDGIEIALRHEVGKVECQFGQA